MAHPLNVRSARVLCAVLFTLCIAWPSAEGADPSVSALQPFGIQRGTEATLVLSGARLADAKSVLLYRPGVKLIEVKATADNRVEAKVSVAPDCSLGLHAIRLRTATGLSNLRLFSIGALKETAEKEPNNDFAQPQLIELNTTVSGVIQNEDVDYFSVNAKKGDRITVELEGVRLGNTTFFDPFAAILNTQRFELARSDDAPLLQQDCLCQIIAPTDGPFIVQVRESAYGGSGNCKYRVHIGSFPRPTGVLPTGAQPGQNVDFRWRGDVLGELTASVTIPTDESSEFDLFARDSLGIAPSPNRVRITDLPSALEAEPNDAREKAPAVTVPVALSGVIDKPGDIDHFRFSAKKNQTYDIRVFARKTLRSPLDAVLSVVRSNGAGVGNNDDSGGPDSYLKFRAPADDEYVVRIQDQLGEGGPDYVYRVEISAPKPTLSLSLPERIQYVPVTVSVPRNNRIAVMVNAARANFGGELKLSVDGVPDGLTVDDVVMPANRSTIPMLFSASNDAPLAGVLADLRAQPTDSKTAVVGHLKQRTMLVRGQNNRDVWGHDAHRLALAVTDESPYSINIIQPKAPIARNGSMQLKVVATRKEGFKAAIPVFLLYNPPGIGSSRSISIPADKTEATIPLTANGSAAIGEWPIIVLARANTGKGNLEVASQMAKLNVSDTFFNFTFDKSAGELGQPTDVVVRVEVKKEFEGDCKVELLGLPAKTSTEANPQVLKKDTKELIFPIKIEPTARPGKFQTLVCRATVAVDGEPVVQTLGRGELRIDKPLPAKPAAKPAAKPTAKPAPKKEVKRRLSRLEQLRLQKKTDGAEKQ